MRRECGIYYFCYSHNRPTGGQKETYKHVDILNASGYQAFAVHTAKGFRLTWFENRTKTVHFDEFRRIFNQEQDYIVLPEDLGSKILNFPGKKVIFNKGIYNGFVSFGDKKPPVYPYHHPEVICVLTVSDHNSEHLRFAYPNLDVIRVYPGIDSDLFAYKPLREKRQCITYVPKSLPALLSLYHTLQSRAEAGINKLKEYDWILLHDRSEQDVATILRDSLIFIFLSVEEGLPQTVLEAMSCGCLVAGYGSGPLRECLPPGFQFEHGDLIGIAKYIEAITDSFPHRVKDWEALAVAGYKKALYYSPERQRASVLEAWDRILRRR